MSRRPKHRPTCKRCRERLWNSRQQVQRWLEHARLKAHRAAPMAEKPAPELLAHLRELLGLLGQLAGHCSGCSSLAVAAALHGTPPAEEPKPRKRRRGRAAESAPALDTGQQARLTAVAAEANANAGFSRPPRPRRRSA